MINRETQDRQLAVLVVRLFLGLLLAVAAILCWAVFILGHGEFNALFLAYDMALVLGAASALLILTRTALSIATAVAFGMMVSALLLLGILYTHVW